MIRFCVKKTPNGHESALIAIILSYLVVKGFFLLSWLKGKDYSCTRKELAKIGILSHEEPDYIVHVSLLRVSSPAREQGLNFDHTKNEVLTKEGEQGRAE